DIHDARLAAILRTIISAHDAVTSHRFGRRLEKITPITGIGNIKSIMNKGQKIGPASRGGYAYGFIAGPAAKKIAHSDCQHRITGNWIDTRRKNGRLQIVMAERG